MARRQQVSQGDSSNGRLVALLGIAEDGVLFLVALLLVAIAALVLVRTVIDLLSGHQLFAQRVTAATNGVLFVIIVMEILRTVVSHFQEGGFQLMPFLIIGIISAVRHILTVGAQLSLSGTDGSTAVFRRTEIELGVNAAVVLALVIGLVLVRRTEREPDAE